MVIELSHHHFTAPFLICLLLIKRNDLSVKGKYLILSENEQGRSDGCRHSSTGISPRPMLVGASRNALRAFNARVSLTCLCVTARRLPPLLDGPVESLAQKGRGVPAVRLNTDRTYPSALCCAGVLLRAFFVKEHLVFAADQKVGERESDLPFLHQFGSTLNPVTMLCSSLASSRRRMSSSTHTVSFPYLSFSGRVARAQMYPL